MAGVPKGRNTSAKGKPEGSMKEEEEKKAEQMEQRKNRDWILHYLR